MNPGDTYTETFSDEGTFDYFCEYHGTRHGDGMAGTVTVLAGTNGGGQGDNRGDGERVKGANDDLPETGGETGAFLYIALILIAAGLACWCLDQEAI